MTQSPLYTNIYHDRRTDDIFVWYEDGSKQQYSTKHRFYTPIKGEYGSLPCDMTDVNGNPMYVAFCDGETEKGLKEKHYGAKNHLSEIDIDYRTRWLQEHYSGQDDLKFETKNFQLCFYDIEVATGNAFSPPEEAIYPINVITTYFSKENVLYTFGLKKDISDVAKTRLSSLNDFLFDVGRTFVDKGMKPGQFLQILRESPIYSQFDLPENDDVGEFDVVKILNFILSSATNRDKFLEIVSSEGIEIPLDISKYIDTLIDYKSTLLGLQQKLDDEKAKISTIATSQRPAFKKQLADKKRAFKEYQARHNAVIREERKQKEMVRAIMEITLPVQKGVYPESPKYVYVKCDNERELIMKTFKCISYHQVDFISGWNTSGYDFPYIFNRCQQLKIQPSLMTRAGRVSDALNKCFISKDKKEFKGGLTYYDVNIAGTTHWDYLMLYRLYSRSERADMKLDTIGREEVGDVKLPLSNGYMTYKTNWDEFVEYNVQDVNLLVKIDQTMKLIETSIGVCSQARIPYDGLWETKKIIVGFLLNYLHSRKIVMPPLKEHAVEGFPGAFVFTKPGHKSRLISFDYRSMYPSITISGNISMEVKVKYPEGQGPTPEELKNLVISPVPGIYFRKDVDGLIPSVMKLLFDGRTELKNQMKVAKKEGRLADAAYLDMKQNAYKIYGNSLYGLLGLRFFQFYDKECAHSVTAFGVDLIKYTITQVSDFVDNRLYNDTRFEQAFGVKPTIQSNKKIFDRFSHGDTDSFFMYFDDIYAPFEEKYGKECDIVVFDKNGFVSRTVANSGDYAEIAKVADDVLSDTEWFNYDDYKKSATISKGIFTDDSKGLKVFFNKHTLTDFSRVFDAALFNSVLDAIMTNFYRKWNCKSNEFFLKREKCILNALVTAKKKYLCEVESNEDILYPSPEIAITGLEVVRSSTSLFAKPRLKELAVKITSGASKTDMRDLMRKYRREFYEHVERGDIMPIAIPSGIGSNPPDAKIVARTKGHDYRVVAGSVWNDLVRNDVEMREEGLQPIFKGNKIKLLKVNSKNQYKANYIAFYEEFPDRLKELFEIDWDYIFQVTMENTAGKLFVAAGWPEYLLRDKSEELMMFA